MTVSSEKAARAVLGRERRSAGDEGDGRRGRLNRNRVR
jgi:hypothetical protein